MDRVVSFNDVYGAAGELTRHHIDDVAGFACVERLRAFRGEWPIAIQGPIRAFSGTSINQRDPVEAAVTAMASGQPSGLSITVHRAMPGLGGDNPPVDVAELVPTQGGMAYWFADSSDRGRALDDGAPVMLAGRNKASDLAICVASLRFAFAVAREDRRPLLSGPIRDLVALARDRILAELYPQSTLLALSTRQTILAEATSSYQARQLADRGAKNLVPLRVSRAELDGQTDTPMCAVVDKFRWSVRQPVEEGTNRPILRYATGADGVAYLSRNFGSQPTRLLCLNAELLEFDAVLSAQVAARRTKEPPPDDPMQLAVRISAARESEIVSRKLLWQLRSRKLDAILRRPPTS